MLVSIIIPCFNAAPFVAAAIESALNQTHRDLDVIVVDDGSTDESATVAARYESAGVRLRRQPNRGASAARNLGLQLARGDYIQYLDADDLLDAGKIARQLDRLGGDGNGRALASARWGRFTTNPALARFVDESVFRDFDPALEFLIEHVRDGHMMHPAAWLVPRTVADAAGPWDETLSLNDDGEYFARVMTRSSRIAYVPEAKTYYRSALPSSLSRRRDRRALESLYRSVASVAVSLEAVENSPRIRKALADYWQRLAYELYPDAADLFADARRQVRKLGGSALQPHMGGRQQALARFVGWRLARRLGRLFHA